MELDNNERKKAMDIATWWGLIVNLLLSIGKLVVGYIGHSQALIADGLHSLSDLVSDAMVLMATHHSNIDADEDHPYGHARYETFATITLAVLLSVVGIGIGVDAINHLIDYKSIAVPTQITLVIAGISIISKEVLYQYTMLVARRVKSKLLEANAWHHRSDAISSIVVFIGIAGAMLGYPLLDSVAAIVVALMICKIGWDLGHQSFQELVDTGLEPETLQAMETTILSVDGVNQMHMLRTRKMGHSALADVHILVSPKLSVSEGHQISEAVEMALTKKFDEIIDVTVHIDPEDDELTENSCKHLPLRAEVLSRLKTHWKDIPETQQLLHTTLHYLDGRIDIELVLPLNIIQSGKKANELSQQIETASQQLDCIGSVIILYK
ncbi:Cobalt-zinc-cadmium resistance protein [hydrothermal vent metagenome]|uniref:Cobalt-zinc-cadmium resistance protein n=1 Tax=hydrothermal vent metagenome TaxID=652676 RepID=A0A3B0X6J7_9ZZZZ